jgi:riboflavin kinase/FMN adenylyltransferase
MLIWRRPGLHTSKPSVVSIGNFDGIHRGHKQLLAKTKSLADANKVISCLLTFEPYPQAFFHSERNIPRLTILREKIFLAQQSGIDLVYALPFGYCLSQYSAQQFIDTILLQQCQALGVVVGEDFHFGYQRQGNVSSLQQDSQFVTTLVPAVLQNDQRISSTRVRAALQAGDLDVAHELLGHRYFMIGRVVRGSQRGRQLGFPTANISLQNRLPPLNGVYAVTVDGIVNGSLRGVANIGTRPTVDGLNAMLEVHLFDFAADIYGKYVHITFMKKIRDEIRFTSLDALKAQIAKDVVTARECLD